MLMISKCTGRVHQRPSAQLTQCIDAVAGSTSWNRLTLNSDKTEVLWCSTTGRQGQLPRTPLSVSRTLVDPVHRVRDLGIHIDGDLMMCSHVQKTTSACFATLRQLRQIQQSVPYLLYRHWSVLCSTSLTSAMPFWLAFQTT